MSDPVRRRARKDHTCTLCGRVIRRGRRYVYEKITPWDHPDNDGYFTVKIHLGCNRAWYALADDWDYEIPDPGTFREYRREWLLERRERLVT